MSSTNSIFFGRSVQGIIGVLALQSTLVLHVLMENILFLDQTILVLVFAQTSQAPSQILSQFLHVSAMTGDSSNTATHIQLEAGSVLHAIQVKAAIMV